MLYFVQYFDPILICLRHTGLCPPANVDPFSTKLTVFADAVARWMQSKRLQLNSDKTEVLWCAMQASTARRRDPDQPSSVGAWHGYLTDADLVMWTRAKDGFQVLCSPQAATFNSSVSANDYVPDSYRFIDNVQAGLRKCCLGWSSCLPVPASLVVDERGSTAHLRCTSLGPHLQPIGSGLWREYGSRRPCSCTRPLIELRHHTWVNWFMSPICLVDVPIVCWYCPLNCLPSVAEPSRSPDPPSGTACRTTWYLPHLCQPSVSV